MREYEEYAGVNSGDKEIDKRVVRTLRQLSNEPRSSIQKSCGDRHQSKAVYRLLSNRKFKPEQVRQVSVESSRKQIKASGAKIVLLPQDTSTLHYTNLQSTTGLGITGKDERSRGLLLHTALAIGLNNEIYGLMGQEVKVREPEKYGKRHKRKKLSIEEKESIKWQKMMKSADELVPDGVLGVHISDREGDIYEYYEQCALLGSKYLCRRTYNRRIADEHGELSKYIDKLPESGELALHVPRDSHTKRKSREARLTVKFGECTILRPQNLKITSENDLAKLTVYVITAVEKGAPPDVKEPISWQLITNLPVSSFGDAVEKIDWYTKRWRIEDFHYTLKSGCAIEKRQASSREKLEKLIALYSVIALDIMHMTWLARVNPDVSCEILFSEEEWKILYCVANKTNITPENIPTVREAVRYIAILGGFLGRNSDGEPGVKSIWLGLEKLRTILWAKQFL